MSSEKIDVLLDLVKEIRQDIKNNSGEQIKQGVDIEHNKDSLVEHMKRCDLIEETVELLKLDMLVWGI